jgi:uncharacterized protein
MVALESGAPDSEVIDRGPTVTVTGRAVVRAEPDEAVLWISLSTVRDAPGPALSDVSARGNELVALLDRLGVERADRSTTGIAVNEEFDHTSDGRRSLGYRAVSRVSIHSADPNLIGRLIAQATESLAARIDGPRWLISASNPARLEASRQAAADSRRRAQAYAEGVGAMLGPLIRLIEADERFSIRAAGGLTPLAADPVPIEPGQQEVTAAVRATFALSPG